MDISAMSRMAGAAALPQPQAVTGPTRAPDDLVVEDFNRALRPDAPTQGPGQLTAAPPAGAPPTLGDAILEGLHRISSDGLQAWDGIKRGVGASVSPSVADVMEFQSNILQFTFLYGLVASGVSKSAQNIDSLVKLQ